MHFEFVGVKPNSTPVAPPHLESFSSAISEPQAIASPVEASDVTSPVEASDVTSQVELSDVASQVEESDVARQVGICHVSSQTDVSDVASRREATDVTSQALKLSLVLVIFASLTNLYFFLFTKQEGKKRQGGWL